MADYSELLAILRAGGLPCFKESAEAIEDLEARLRIKENQLVECQARNDFLIAELDKIIEKAKKQ